MTRLRRIATCERIFFITTNLAEGRAVFDESERDLILEIISVERKRESFQLYAYMVMPDHLHLIFEPLAVDMPTAMRRIKSASGSKIQSKRKTLGPLWQARYFDSVIRRTNGLWDKLDYVHMNPVVAGLASEPGDWRWSSFHHYRNRALGVTAPAVIAPIEVDVFELPFDPNARIWPR
ncbi:MAG TPA: transposase [Candidatus Acidoferrales bacterium]|nr:transposase [Candidatus Acidoferrales bacterium]